MALKSSVDVRTGMAEGAAITGFSFRKGDR
jgi:hypothetical protein